MSFSTVDTTIIILEDDNYNKQEHITMIIITAIVLMSTLLIIASLVNNSWVIFIIPVAFIIWGILWVAYIYCTDDTIPDNRSDSIIAPDYETL
jgi:hypothetical protein